MVPRQPEIYTAQTIKDWNAGADAGFGLYLPARPMGHNLYSILWRWRVAFGVLTGRYDALKWEDKDSHA